MTDHDLFGEVPPAAPVEKASVRLPRSPNGINIHRFLEGYGITVLPYTDARGWKDRPANTIYGGRTVGRLMRKDVDRAGTVIRCIQVSNPHCFEDVMIWSVWQFIGAHFAHRKPVDAIEQFRGIDLAVIKKRAQRLTVGSYGRMAKTWPVLATLIASVIIEKGLEREDF